MTRVSTYSQNQFFLRANQISQQKLVSLQRQVSTGERAQTFKELRGDSLVLTTARSRLAQIENLTNRNIQTKAKLDLRESAVREITNIAKDLKAKFIQAHSANDASVFQQEADNDLQRVVGILNSRDQNGDYMFAGTRTDTPPVTLTTNGTPPPLYTITYNNDTQIEKATIDDGLTISIGVLATDDPASPSGAFQGLITTLNYFAAGTYPPPFAAEQLPPAVPVTVTPDAITDQIDQALTSVNNLDATLGIRQKMLDDADARLTNEIDLTKNFIAQVKDVDIAEVLININQQRLGLEATYRITASLQDLTLLNFI